MSNTKTCSRKN